MASSLALAACGDAGLESGTAPELMEQQAQEATQERRIILYRLPSGELYTVDNQGQSQLVARRATSPVFSPDGRKAAFSKLPDTWTPGDGLTQAALHVADLASGRVEQLTSGHGDFAPVWTPDSRYLLFVSGTRATGPSFWRIKVNGTGLQPLSLTESEDVGPRERRIILYIAPPASDSEVSWGPGERRIILYRSINANGASEVNVASFRPNFEVESAYSLGEGTDPHWTPEGNVAFTRQGSNVEMSIE